MYELNNHYELIAFSQVDNFFSQCRIRRKNNKTILIVL